MARDAQTLSVTCRASAPEPKAKDKGGGARTIGVFATVGHGEEALSRVLGPPKRTFILELASVDRLAARSIPVFEIPPLHKHGTA